MVKIEKPKSHEDVAVGEDRRLALACMLIAVIALAVYFALQNTV